MKKLPGFGILVCALALGGTHGYAQSAAGGSASSAEPRPANYDENGDLNAGDGEELPEGSEVVVGDTATAEDNNGYREREMSEPVEACPRS